MERKKAALGRISHKLPTKKKRKKRKYRFYLFLLSLIVILFGFYHFISNNHYSFANNQRESSKILPESFSHEANHFLQTDGKNRDLPLLLQSDERWGNLNYGLENSDNTLAYNGCALASLAMISSFWQKKLVTPEETLTWGKNNYYVQGQGTSWEIFPDFAKENHLNYENLGNNFSRAKEFMMSNVPVIVSVKPGTFTTTGHIMVLTTTAEGNIKAYDPNDTPEKRHYEQTFSDDIFLSEGINYWAFWM